MPPSPPKVSLLRAAAFVSLLVLALSVVSLFSLSNSNTKHLAALERIQEIHAIEVQVQNGRASYKAQVQEWKNILLRGHEASDLTKYQSQFTAQATETESLLKAVRSDLEALGEATAEVDKLILDYGALNLKYAEVMSKLDPKTLADARAIDAGIRGVDRPVNDLFESLAANVHQTALSQAAQLTAQSAQRYQTLRQVTLVAATLTVLSSFVLVFLANRPH